MELNFNTNFILCFHSLEKLAHEMLDECTILFRVIYWSNQ